MVASGVGTGRTTLVDLAGAEPVAAGDDIAVGIDVVDISRFQRLLSLRGDALTTRVFTAAELRDCAEKPGRLAARFAAKEATSKALGAGIGTVRWRDVEVLADSSGQPRLRLHGAARALARSRGVTTWTVSLTHDGSTAAAIVAAREGAGR